MTPEASAEALTARPAGRSFPWPCAHCGKKTVWPAAIHYREALWYGGRPYVVDLPQLNIPRCGKCGELVFDYWAEEQIEQVLRVRVAGAAAERDGAGGMSDD